LQNCKEPSLPDGQFKFTHTSVTCKISLQNYPQNISRLYKSKIFVFSKLKTLPFANLRQTKTSFIRSLKIEVATTRSIWHHSKRLPTTAHSNGKTEKGVFSTLLKDKQKFIYMTDKSIKK